MTKKEQNRLSFFCECHSPDHTMVWEVDEWVYPGKEEISGKELMIYYDFNHFRNFFSRVRIALQYIFKKNKNDITYSELIICDQEQLEKMRDMIDEVLTSQKNLHK